jgi:hypothetical protein
MFLFLRNFSFIFFLTLADSLCCISYLVLVQVSEEMTETQSSPAKVVFRYEHNDGQCPETQYLNI